jgi:multidrug efflux pump subunit AcrA (membrane-fusion protein)
MPSAPTVVNGALAAIAAGAGVAAYLTIGQTSSARAQVNTAAVQHGSVLSTVSASGNVSAARSLSLGFQASGTLTAVYVKPGQHVRKGQPLAKIDDSSQAAAVRSARAGLLSAQANLQQLRQPLTPQEQAQDQVSVEQAQA